jgi:hypothetical protein
MAAEGFSALIVRVERPDTMPAWSAWAAAALLGVALTSMVVVQVPLHARLADVTMCETRGGWSAAIGSGQRRGQCAASCWRGCWQAEATG